MNGTGFWMRACTLIVSISLLMSFTATPFVAAQTEGPTMLHPRLDVRPVISGLTTPITMAFLGENEFLLLEKNTGIVQHIVDGAVQNAALDLAVNFFSERGLLGIALDPDFESNHFVYLYWSCIAPPPPADNPFLPTQDECAETPELGPDSEDVLAVPLLGNRVDRFTWDGESLTFDRNLIMLRSFQNDAAPEPPDQGDEAQPPRGNHDAGVLTFGEDGKLYVLVGDVGRRGQLQNLPSGPTETGLGTTVPDDQFGGPEPDDAHFTGVILRLNPDGTTPEDNPFFDAGAEMGGEVGENIQKIFAYGIRNSFGMAVDPLSGNLWQQENGEDAYDELNLVEPGMNSGWIQFTGPAERLAEYKQIETTSLHHEDFPNLQQFRWGPERIADTPEDAQSRLFVLPGSEYSDPEFSWKHVLAPAAIGFLDSSALGSQFQGDLFVGFSVPEPLGGPLFVFNLTGNRQRIGVDDPLLEDRVADNTTFHDMTESESLLIGQNFGVITDIKTGPNGNLFVVSLDQGTVYEIFRIEGGNGDVRTFSAELTGAAEVPGPGDPDGSGTATITLDPSQGEVCFELTVSNIELPATAAHIHEAPVGEAGDVVVPLTPAPDASGSSSGCISNVDRALTQNIIQNPEQYYVNVHNAEFSDGAVRGQLTPVGNGGGGDDSEVEFEATLTGDQEVPPVDTTMRGDAEIEVENNRLEFELRVSNNTNEIFAAHIHCAPPSESGPIGVTLFMGTFTEERGLLAQGNITAPDANNECGWTDVDNIIAAIESGNTYVNVHTTEESGGFPSGEIRGNLILDDDDDGEDDDNGNGGRTFSTEMSGAAEVPGPGDTDGSGTASLRFNPGQGEVCFELTVANILLPATAAHIHEAPVGEAGDVVVPLTPPDASGSSSGCVSADPALIEAIMQNPEGYYVNVHNEEFPDGAVRGQLSN
jgi:aldose sugar dehydrogenase